MDILIGAVGSILAAIFLFSLSKIYHVWERRGNVFISMPMEAAGNQQQYEQLHDLAEAIVLSLRGANFKSYSAIADIKDPTRFEQPATVAADVFTKIRRSRYFVIVLPERVSSGCLVELGYALGRKRRVVIFHQGSSQSADSPLPWLVRGLETTPGANQLVRKVPYDNLQDVKEYFGKNPQAILK